ncbi:MAG TPA: hypothetical protein VG964_00495 [Candidatus Saccharimonadales bacterium]|nr:hypothetical protein [Candidatus Saccharimonadales bacterium]
MTQLRESGLVLKEHLSLEEIQIAIGDLCMSATGFTVAFMDLATGMRAIVPWVVGGATGMLAGRSAIENWRQGREKLTK